MQYRIYNFPTANVSLTSYIYIYRNSIEAKKKQLRYSFKLRRISNLETRYRKQLYKKQFEDRREPVDRYEIVVKRVLQRK